MIVTMAEDWRVALIMRMSKKLDRPHLIALASYKL